VFRGSERRTGFDRRLSEEMVARYRDRPRLLIAVLAAVVVLNLLDYLFTLRALARGATEVNPVMAALFEFDPAVAGLVKMGIALCIVVSIWGMRRYRRVLQLSLLAVGTLSVLIAYHLAMVIVGA